MPSAPASGPSAAQSGSLGRPRRSRRGPANRQAAHCEGKTRLRTGGGGAGDFQPESKRTAANVLPSAASAGVSSVARRRLCQPTQVLQLAVLEGRVRGLVAVTVMWGCIRGGYKQSTWLRRHRPSLLGNPAIHPPTFVGALYIMQRALLFTGGAGGLV
jgi:hypothetical protein